MKERTTTFRCRWLAAFSTASALVVLAACTPGNSAPKVTQPTGPVTTGFDTSQKVTLKVADGWGTTGTGAVFGKVISAFEKKYPNVTVDRDTTDYASYQQRINTLGASPSPPDVMMLETSGYGQGFYQFVRAGLVLPLDPYAQAYGWDSRFGAPSSLDVFRFDTTNHNQWGSGSLYGLPEQNSMITVFYNKKLLAQAGVSSVPTTFAEFEQSLAAARGKGITPIAQSNSYIHLDMALWDSFVSSSSDVNNWIYGQDGATFGTDASMKAAQTITDWQKAGYFENGVSGESDSDAASLFLGGKALYYIEGSWMAGAVDSSLKADGGGAFQLPSATAGAKAPVGGGFSTPLVISSRTSHADVAAAFLNYFVSVENSDYLLDNGWGLPGGTVSPSAAAGPSLSNQVLTMVTDVEAAGGAGTTPFLDWATPTLTNELPADLQSLAAGHTSAADFASQIQSNWSSFQQQRKAG